MRTTREVGRMCACDIGIEMQHGHAANFSGHAYIKGFGPLSVLPRQAKYSLSLSLW